MRSRSYILLLTAALLVAAPGGAAALIIVAPDDEEREDRLDDLAQLESERLEAIMDTLELLEAKKDVAAMLALYRKGLAITTGNLTLRERYVLRGVWVAGYALEHKGDAGDVLDLLNELEPQADIPDEPQIRSTLWWLQTVALRRLDRTEEADARQAKALEFNAGDTNYHYYVGRFLRYVWLPEQSILEFETALATADSDWARAKCLAGIAFTHLWLEQYEEATAQYEKALVLFSEGPKPRDYIGLIEEATVAFYHLGRYHELRGRHKETVAANERALELLPDELDEELGEAAAQNLTAIGDAYLALNKPKKALEALERAREVAPDVPGVYSSLGDALNKLGKDTEARQAHTRCERLYRDRIAQRPNLPSSYNNLAWFFVTHDAKLDEALKLSKTSLELDPDTDAYLDTLAEIYYRMGEHDKAIEWIKKVFELDPPPRHLIYFEQQLDKFEKAAKAGR